MLKKIVLIAAAIFATVLLAGCGNKTDQNATSTTPAAQEQQASNQATNGVALPTDKPSYMGKVINVANDQITIYKADLSAQPQGAPQGAQGANQEAPQGPPSESNQDTAQGANGKGPGPGGQITFSEQAETIKIPESAQLVTGSPRGGNISSIKVSDIKQDQIIQVWEKDGVITFVQVMDSNRNMPNDGAQQQKVSQ